MVLIFACPPVLTVIAVVIYLVMFRSSLRTLFGRCLICSSCACGCLAAATYYWPAPLAVALGVGAVASFIWLMAWAVERALAFSGEPVLRDRERLRHKRPPAVPIASPPREYLTNAAFPGVQSPIPKVLPSREEGRPRSANVGSG